MRYTSLGAEARLSSRTRTGEKITEFKLVSPLIGMAVDLLLVSSYGSIMELNL